METLKTIEPSKKKKKHFSLWLLIPCMFAVVTISILCAYFYYKAPTYKYPKKVNTYEIDRKIFMTPDGTLSVFFKSIHECDRNLMSYALRQEVLEDYANKYYKGAIYDDWVNYIMNRLNEDISKEYGEDWYNNLVIEKVEKNKTEHFTYATLQIKCNEKPFKFNYLTQGFNDYYTLSTDSIKPVFDKYMNDDNNRPKDKYPDFIR